MGFNVWEPEKVMGWVGQLVGGQRWGRLNEESICGVVNSMSGRGDKG